jgi:hypothetical protein
MPRASANGLDAQGMCAGTTAARNSRCYASREPHGLAVRYSISLVISSATVTLAIDISDCLVCRIKDRSDCNGTDDRAKGAGKEIEAGVGGAAGVLFKGPLLSRFPCISDLLRDDGKARQSYGTECRRDRNVSRVSATGDDDPASPVEHVTTTVQKNLEPRAELRELGDRRRHRPL